MQRLGPRAPVRYTGSGELRIAYRTFGNADLDLLVVLPTIGTVELLDEDPVGSLTQRMTRFARVISWDRRGTGLSDPTREPPTLEEQMDDARAVLDAAGASRVVVAAEAEAVALAVMIAATYPERVSAMVLLNGMARMTRAEGYEWALDPEERRIGLVEPMLARWGSGETGSMLAPVLAGRDPRYAEWWGRWERISAPPGTVRARLELIGEIDVRAILPRVRAPTLVCDRPDAHAIDSRHSRYLAEQIPNAELRELPGRDAVSFGDGLEAYMEALERFASGRVTADDGQRVLATVLFTDIVGSTQLAGRLGDRGWRATLERHDALSREEIGGFGGEAIKSTGDGFLATFDGPARAARCARRLVERATAELDLTLRAGLHTGEIERIGADVGGMAVHIGSRIAALATPGEALASSTVRDLVAGSGIEFADRGEAELRGVPGRWHLLAVDRV